jgi:hypothetical protein
VNALLVDVGEQAEAGQPYEALSQVSVFASPLRVSPQ